MSHYLGASDHDLITVLACKWGAHQHLTALSSLSHKAGINVNWVNNANIKILITRSCLRTLGQVSPCRRGLEGWQEGSCTAPGSKKRSVERMQTVSYAVWERDLKKRIAEGTEKWAYIVSADNKDRMKLSCCCLKIIKLISADESFQSSFQAVAWLVSSCTVCCWSLSEVIQKDLELHLLCFQSQLK